MPPERSAPGRNLAVDLVKLALAMMVVGIHAEPLVMDLNQLVRGKKQMRGCHDSTPASFAEAIARLAEAPELYARMITHRLPLDRAEDAIALARSRAALKVMLFPAGGLDD